MTLGILVCCCLQAMALGRLEIAGGWYGATCRFEGKVSFHAREFNVTGPQPRTQHLPIIIFSDQVDALLTTSVVLVMTDRARFCGVKVSPNNNVHLAAPSSFLHGFRRDNSQCKMLVVVYICTEARVCFPSPTAPFVSSPKGKNKGETRALSKRGGNTSMASSTAELHMYDGLCECARPPWLCCRPAAPSRIYHADP